MGLKNDALRPKRSLVGLGCNCFLGDEDVFNGFGIVVAMAAGFGAGLILPGIIEEGNKMN